MPAGRSTARSTTNSIAKRLPRLAQPVEEETLSTGFSFLSAGVSQDFCKTPTLDHTIDRGGDASGTRDLGFRAIDPLGIITLMRSGKLIENFPGSGFLFKAGPQVGVDLINGFIQLQVHG